MNKQYIQGCLWGKRKQDCLVLEMSAKYQRNVFCSFFLQWLLVRFCYILVQNLYPEVRYCIEFVFLHSLPTSQTNPHFMEKEKVHKLCRWVWHISRMFLSYCEKKLHLEDWHRVKKASTQSVSLCICFPFFVPLSVPIFFMMSLWLSWDWNLHSQTAMSPAIRVEVFEQVLTM